MIRNTFRRLVSFIGLAGEEPAPVQTRSQVGIRPPTPIRTLRARLFTRVLRSRRTPGTSFQGSISQAYENRTGEIREWRKRRNERQWRLNQARIEQARQGRIAGVMPS